jgi:hypothetical protein
MGAPPVANADDFDVGRSLETRVILPPPWQDVNSFRKEVGKLLASNICSIAKRVHILRNYGQLVSKICLLDADE